MCELLWARKPGRFCYYRPLKMAAGGLSDHQIEEFREAFRLYDRNDDGTITNKDLGMVLKAIGQNPSDEETRQLVDRVRIFVEILVENSKSEKTIHDLFEKDESTYSLG